MARCDCTVETIEYEWANRLDRMVFLGLKATCDISGRLCMTAGDFRDKHAIKKARTGKTKFRKGKL